MGERIRWERMNPLAVLPSWSTIPAIMAKRKAKRGSSRRSRKKRVLRRPRASRIEKLPKDAVTLVVILRARDGQETLLEAELRALAGPSRKEEDCFTFDLHRSADAPGAFLL